MHLDRYLRMIAGFFVMLSVVLGWLVSPWFYLFTAFVGLNLFQSAFTNWCPTTVSSSCAMSSAPACESD